MSIGNSATNGPGATDSGSLAIGRWTDFSIPATRLRQGALQKPDFDYTNIGLLFPQNDTSEAVYAVAQMDHRKKYNTPLKLHIHYVQSSALVPNFVCEYKFYNNGQSVPAVFTTISTASGSGNIFDYPGSGSILQIIPFPEILFSGSEGISANLEMKIYRNDNIVTGDVLVKYIDFHYQMDVQGSREEFIK